MDLKEKFVKILTENVKREGVKGLLKWIEDSDFYTAPASTRFHGNYKGGLVEHSINVYESLVKLTDTVKDFPYSLESITIVSLLHDLCKANFYKIGTRNVKNEETGKWEKKEVYEIEDLLPLGHGEKSCLIVQEFLKLTTDELVAIRWHMGGFDTAVKGGDYALSNAYDKYLLAPMLHLADMYATYVIEGESVKTTELESPKTKKTTVKVNSENPTTTSTVTDDLSTGETSTKNVTKDLTPNSKSSDENLTLDDLKRQILDVCKFKISVGVDKNKLYDKIAELNGGKKNPNSINNIDIAIKVRDELKEFNE